MGDMEKGFVQLKIGSEKDIRLIEAGIEAVLFTLGEAVPLSRLAAALECDMDEAGAAICNLMERYNREESGIQLIELDGAYQLCTKVSMYETLIKLTHVPRRHVLTDVLLETLSIIAYKQPITKLEIEAIRGVKSDHAVNKLVEYKLIEEVGRKDAPGRPLLFGTTEDFLRNFGISSLDELPDVKPEKLEDIRQEVEQELQLTLDI